MNPKTARPLIIALGIIALFILFVIIGGKSSNERDRRIQEKTARDEQENLEAIKRSHVLIGMSAEQCRAAWGEPQDVHRTMTADHAFEQWTYPQGVILSFTDGVLVSGSR